MNSKIKPVNPKWNQPWIFILTEKAMTPHSSTLAWKIPWMEEPGKLQSTGSLRVGHDWATSLSLFTFMHWRRKWQPTPVFLPEESQGRESLVGCHLWGHTESDTTEATYQQQHFLWLFQMIYFDCLFISLVILLCYLVVLGIVYPGGFKLWLLFGSPEHLWQHIVDQLDQIL